MIGYISFDGRVADHIFDRGLHVIDARGINDDRVEPHDK